MIIFTKLLSPNKFFCSEKFRLIEEIFKIHLSLQFNEKYAYILWVQIKHGPCMIGECKH